MTNDLRDYPKTIRQNHVTELCLAYFKKGVVDS